MKEKAVFIVMEQYMSEEPCILGVFSTEELADMFIYDNEMDEGAAIIWQEEWTVDGGTQR